MFPTPIPIYGSAWASDEAKFVEEFRKYINQQLRRAETLGTATSALQQLDTVCNQCTMAGWDGESARPITELARRKATEFLKALPLGVEAPDVSPEPDGFIALEWYRATDKILTVTVNGDGWIYYAALIGLKRKHGAEPMQETTPEDVIELIRKVVQ